MGTGGTGSAIAVALALCLHAGCPPAAEVKTTSPTLQADALPTEPDALLKIADEQFEQGAANNSIVALERALHKNPDWAQSRTSYDAHWRLARAYAELCEPDNAGQRNALLPTALTAGRKATELLPNRVEGRYYLAVLYGYNALVQKGDTKLAVQQIQTEGETAASADEKFDHGGPLRLLGTLLARAPAPPLSIGDPDKALQYLKRAAAVDGSFPPNTIYLAEALVADERYQEAEAALQTARQLLQDSRWARKRDAWKELLVKAERKLRAKQP